ncbi:phosphatidylglycerophosphatase A family protein [Roseospira navarrensis]|uniref:Phosphatidylglycerophosphatase A n=1 Tax=Roseospira navarrensis TaxID=140058 RepID=A0A7X2D448_9PROT|nr:phosphatidylglycerophosphatase A [Roseospira navarrensis]MQX37553.1 phosphatidylglycerophosphatase A [Roseospira navarrensis]
MTPPSSAPAPEPPSGPPRRVEGMAGWLAVWFGSGLSPWAPGTAGSLAALPFAWGFAWAGGPWGLLAAALVVFAVGLWASTVYARSVGRDDPGEVVIDEVAGQWLALVPAGLDPVLFGVGFVAFRVFDIAKPWPVGWLDRMVPGGLGIMADDMAAGVYAAVVVLAASTIRSLIA